VYSFVQDFFVHGKGPLTGNMVEAMSWFNTKAHPNVGILPTMPDMQFHFLAGTIHPDDFCVFNAKVEGQERYKRLVAEGLKYTTAIMPTLLHPQSVGHVHIKTKDALDAPAIQPNYLTKQADVDTMVQGCIVAEQLFHEPALKRGVRRILTDEFVPNNPYSRLAQPEQYWEWYLRQQANTLYHPVGTCKIGQPNDPMAVVDPQLRVYGVRKLRVADASVMPHLVSGNTNIPSVMIGERCADFILKARQGQEQPQQSPVGVPTNTRAKL
jgi:choline dehydrogenase-like flavoprotein